MTPFAFGPRGADVLLEALVKQRAVGEAGERIGWRRC
jgi:hypothetical protein